MDVLIGEGLLWVGELVCCYESELKWLLVVIENVWCGVVCVGVVRLVVWVLS